MLHPSALDGSPAVEGAVVLGSYNILATVECGAPAGPRAGDGGTLVGRFGWVSNAGLVLNSRSASSDIAGVVLPPFGFLPDPRRMYFDDLVQAFRVRQGLPLALLSRGNVWVRFPAGAIRGQQVYANTLDGTAISGYSDAGELTPWSVVTDARPGDIAIITTWSTFT